ncbi:MAG: tRNA pseudouridine(38-40) synthase TruA [Acidobacteria bacterium]|nr:tRNA pseudouridine(38-40) synthase TruA [Acidobacteriota bacterium]MCI0662632.1 tRNA pseudouridine(38-40) synthase TruA [Acidobacteriota bacterium]
MNYRITLAYDGTDYSGWQFQLGRRTIQAVLSGALEKLDGAPVTAYAAGRTDAGVHAEGQVVSFRLTREMDGATLLRALNGNLPQDIRVLESSQVADDFHARTDAKSKTYLYQLYNSEVMNPLLARYALHYPYDVDLDRLIEDSHSLVGTHDFTAFTVAECETRTRVRSVTGIKIERAGNILTFSFTGDGFLRYQIRTMVEALVEANRGRLKTRSIAELILSRDRSLVGAPAPAKGLTLMKVEY